MMLLREICEQEERLSSLSNSTSASSLLGQCPERPLDLSPLLFSYMPFLSLFSSGAAFGSFIILCVGGLISQALGWPFIFYIFGESLSLQAQALCLPAVWLDAHVTCHPLPHERER